MVLGNFSPIIIALNGSIFTLGQIEWKITHMWCHFVTHLQDGFCLCGKVDYSTSRKGIPDKSSIISWRPFESTMWYTHNMFDANNLCAVLDGFWEVDTGASKGISLKVNKYLVCITLAAFNDSAYQVLLVWATQNQF